MAKIPRRNLKPLFNENYKGLRVWCPSCHACVKKVCGKSGLPLKECTDPIEECDKLKSHRYKVIVHMPGTENGRKTKLLDTRDYAKAVSAADKYRKKVKNKTDNTEVPERTPNLKSSTSNEYSKNEVLLERALLEYYKFLNDEGVPEHLVKNREKAYIDSVMDAVYILKDVIEAHGKDFRESRVSDIDKNVVGWYFKELGIRYPNPSTFNNFRTNINSFEIWLLDNDYISKRYFKKIEKQDVTLEPTAIPVKEFQDLIALITPESGTFVKKTKHKGESRYLHFYRPWLAKGLYISLELGGRLNDIIYFKFTDIVEEDGKPVYLSIEDHKVNKLKKTTNQKQKKRKILPISLEFQEALKEYGYDNKKGTDEYVLVPEIIEDLEREKEIKRILSGGFKHYYTLLNTGKNLTFKSLRKLDATQKDILTDGHAENLTGHDSANIVKRHYVDKKMAATEQTKKGFSRFGKIEPTNSR